MSRERDIANLVIRKYSLTYPFSIEDFASTVADVKKDSIPFGIDALLFKRSPTRSQHLVILNNQKPQTRRVFTLAHELGHIFLSWHIGEFKCNVSDGEVDFGDIYYQIESEANTFAGELLAPTDTILKILCETNDPIQAFDFLKRMGMSNLAASRTLAERLPRNFLIAETDNEENRINYHYSSPGTILSPLRKHDVYNRDILEIHDPKIYTGIYSSKQVVIWHVPDAKLVRQKHIFANSRDVLLKIYKDSEITGESIVKMDQIVGGVAGYAINLARVRKIPLYAALTTRFKNKEELSYLVRHPLFSAFMEMRYKELSLKHDLH